MIQKDKLTLTFSITIRPEYQGLIPLVSKMNGGPMDENAKTYLVTFLNAYITEQMKALISSSLNGYYGMSQTSLINAAMLAYNDSALASSEWTIIEEADPVPEGE